MSNMTITVGGKVIQERTIESRWSGELEEGRKKLVKSVVEWIFPTVLVTKLTLASSKAVHAATTATSGAEDIRAGFTTIIDIFTAIAEPILWFYALTACILMATKSKNVGLDRLKQVAYAYAGIALLPTFFAFLRWVSEIIKTSIHF